MAHEDPIDVVVDTREQTPWVFSPAARTVRAALPSGDYSVVGLESVIAIERKSLADFCHSLTAGRDRFFREVERLCDMPHRAIIVEANIDSILKGEMRSQASPQSILGSALCIHVDYGVPVVFAGARPSAAWYAERMLRRFRKAAQAANKKEQGNGAKRERSQRALGHDQPDLLHP